MSAKQIDLYVGLISYSFIFTQTRHSSTHNRVNQSEIHTPDLRIHFHDCMHVMRSITKRTKRIFANYQDVQMKLNSLIEFIIGLNRWLTKPKSFD